MLVYLACLCFITIVKSNVSKLKTLIYTCFVDFDQPQEIDWGV